MRKFIQQLTEKHIINNLRKIPGEQTFGIYRFLPLFFLLGASLETCMNVIVVGPNKTNFYTTLKRRQAENLIQEKFLLESSLRPQK